MSLQSQGHVPAQTMRRRRYKRAGLLTLTSYLSNSSDGGYQDRRIGAAMVWTSAATTADTRDERIRLAVEQVSNGSSVPVAAKHFNIPHSTDIGRVASNAGLVKLYSRQSKRRSSFFI